MLVALLNRVQLFLQLVDVLFLGHLHLAQDLLLGVQLSIKILSFGNRLVHLVLELNILLLEDLDLAVGRVQLDLAVLQSQHLILELRARSQQLRVCRSVILLLVFIPRDPHITCLLLVSNDLIQALDAIIQVSLGQLEGLFDTNLLSFKRGNLVDKLVDLLVLVFDLRLALVKQVIFKIHHIGEVLVAIMLVLKLVLDLVAGLVHRVKLVN